MFRVVLILVVIWHLMQHKISIFWYAFGVRCNMIAFGKPLLFCRRIFLKQPFKVIGGNISITIEQLIYICSWVVTSIFFVYILNEFIRSIVFDILTRYYRLNSSIQFIYKFFMDFNFLPFWIPFFAYNFIADVVITFDSSP